MKLRFYGFAIYGAYQVFLDRLNRAVWRPNAHGALEVHVGLRLELDSFAAGTGFPWLIVALPLRDQLLAKAAGQAKNGQASG